MISTDIRRRLHSKKNFFFYLNFRLLQKISKKSKNSRVFILSGTPIVNDVYEISIIANMIRGQIKNNPKIIFEEKYKQHLYSFCYA